LSDAEHLEPELRAVRLRMRGRVQGVWFRGWAMERAGDLGLDGWVRNRRDGTVEAVFSGNVEAIETIVDLCRAGPPHAWVDHVDRLEERVSETAGFEVRETI